MSISKQAFVILTGIILSFHFSYLITCVQSERCGGLVPIAQVALEGEEVLVETLDGLLLQNIVDAVPSVQTPHLHLRLLLSQRLRALHKLVLY